MAIYPAILSSTQPAFNRMTSNYPIKFALNPINSDLDVKHIQVRVARLTNNSPVIASTANSPDNTLYKQLSSLEYKDGYYTVNVSLNDLTFSNSRWDVGVFKVQIRLGSGNLWSGGQTYADWKAHQIEHSMFSEWSSVMLIRAIEVPSVKILNAAEIDDVNTEPEDLYEPSLTPTFAGEYIDNNIVNKENKARYRFILLQNNKEIENSGWILSSDAIDTHRFKTVLDNETSYTVRYEIVTVNGYEVIGEDAPTYSFVTRNNQLIKLSYVKLEVDDSDVYCRENGCINVYLTLEPGFNIAGRCAVIRASEIDGFTQYDDMKIIHLESDAPKEKTLIFQDFTVESGIKYKYGFQYVSSDNLRTEPVFEDNEDIRSIDFEYSYLYRDGVQLKIKFNNSMNSFKHTVLQSKQDTLGGKFPFLSRNGKTYYREFPVNGLISLEMDDDQTFFKEMKDGYYYRDELIIPRDKYYNGNDEARESCDPNAHPVDITPITSFNRDFSYNNIFMERKFREKVEEFLNEFNYKLFKSATEGNIIVTLSNVQLQPNQELGRMIASFTAQAYEVADFTLDNIFDNGIETLEEEYEQTAEEITTFESFGQISGYFYGDKDYGGNASRIDTLIADDMSVRAPEGYKYTLQRIKSISVELYPKVDKQQEINELQEEIAQAMIAEEPTEELEARLEAMQELAAALDRTFDSTNITLIIDGSEILIRTNKPYYLKDLSNDRPEIKLLYSQPIIVNYVCDIAEEKENSEIVVTSMQASRIWGQLSGVFTDTDKVLNEFSFNYQSSETYRIYNPMYGDNSNIPISVFNSYNIKEVIEDEVRLQIEKMYGLGTLKYNKEEDYWYNDAMRMSIRDIYRLDIEADPGTAIFIGQSLDGSDKSKIIIGPTGRYVLYPADDLIKYIAFEYPSFAAINYKCYTNQQLYSRSEGD